MTTMVEGPALCFVSIIDPPTQVSVESHVFLSTECDDTFKVSEYFIITKIRRQII